jgi:hypothetical protein
VNSGAVPVIALLAALPSSPTPIVRYAARIEVKAWAPIEPEIVRASIESAILSALTASLQARLEPSSWSELEGGDYRLELEGRFVDEAESFSVYLTFGSGRSADMPSFFASESGEIGGRSPREMASAIGSLADRAGRRLAALLAPLFESKRLGRVRIPDDADSPSAGGPFPIPDVARPSRAMSDLLDARKPNWIRAHALEALEPSIFDEPDARDAIVLCVLRDPWEELRARCTYALRGAARTHVPTQRALLGALRSEVDPRVMRALVSLTSSFVGLSRKECLEAWLEAIARTATPASVLEDIAALLADEGEVPNLEYALVKCLRRDPAERLTEDGRDHLGWGSRGCLRLLAHNVPPTLRLSIAAAFLERARVFDDWQRSDVAELLQKLLPLMREDRVFRELVLKTAERRSAGRIRADLIRAYGASEGGPACERAIDRLVELARDTRLTEAAVNAVEALARTDPRVRPRALAALGRLSSDPRLIPQLQRYDSNTGVRSVPRDGVVRAIQSLEHAGTGT